MYLQLRVKKSSFKLKLKNKPFENFLIDIYFILGVVVVLYLSGRTEIGANENNGTKEHVWYQNKDCVGVATC